jgi:hypothetical protein
MAYAIIGGLAVATVLTLIFLPALYVTWFRIKEPPAGKATAPTGSSSETSLGNLLKTPNFQERGGVQEKAPAG